MLYDGLQSALGVAGHDVSRVEILFDESTFEGILAGYREARALDLSGFDAVISTKAPTFAVRHPRHVVYLVHTIRVFYDMYDSWTDGSAGAIAQRDRVRELDASALMAIPDGRRFAIGTEVERRVFGLDTAHRAGATVVMDRESFGEWSARLELARVFGRN